MMTKNKLVSLKSQKINNYTKKDKLYQWWNFWTDYEILSEKKKVN